MTQPVIVEIESTPTPVVVLQVPGPQGPAGFENVIVSPTEPAPEVRFINLVWIDTS